MSLNFNCFFQTWIRFVKGINLILIKSSKLIAIYFKEGEAGFFIYFTHFVCCKVFTWNKYKINLLIIQEKVSCLIFEKHEICSSHKNDKNVLTAEKDIMYSKR